MIDLGARAVNPIVVAQDSSVIRIGTRAGKGRLWVLVRRRDVEPEAGGTGV